MKTISLGVTGLLFLSFNIRAAGMPEYKSRKTTAKEIRELLIYPKASLGLVVCNMHVTNPDESPYSYLGASLAAGVEIGKKRFFLDLGLSIMPGGYKVDENIPPYGTVTGKNHGSALLCITGGKYKFMATSSPFVKAAVYWAYVLSSKQSVKYPDRTTQREMIHYTNRFGVGFILGGGYEYNLNPAVSITAGIDYGLGLTDHRKSSYSKYSMYARNLIFSAGIILKKLVK